MIVDRINVVVNEGLVLQTVKTDMVKHDGEIESSGECVDEIDKLMEVSMKLINIGSMQVFDQFNINVMSLSNCVKPQFNLSPNDSFANVLITMEHRFQLEALENDVYCFDDTIRLLNGSDGSQFNIFLKLVTPSSGIKGLKSGPFSKLRQRIFFMSTFSAEEIVPIPRESEDTSRSDSKNVLPSCDDFSSINVPRDDSMTFSNPLFEFDVNFISSDINHLFDEVLEDIECKDSYDSNLDELTFLVTPLSDSNKDECLTPGDDIEILIHHDPSTPMKSIASLLEGFIDEQPFKENDNLFDLE
ncbi:hypothetical protein Tco_0314116 [Tanacetum coccineum]